MPGSERLKDRLLWGSFRVTFLKASYRIAGQEGYAHLPEMLMDMIEERGRGRLYREKMAIRARRAGFEESHGGI